MLKQHRELAAQHWHKADRVVAQAREHVREHGQREAHSPDGQAQRAITYARDHLFERAAVQDARALLETELNRSMGETTHAQVRQESERRAQAGKFRAVDHAGAGLQYTTAAMVGMEREIVTRMREGNQSGYSDPMLAEFPARLGTLDRHPELNAGQRQAVEQVFLSREKIVGLDGIASAGKTTTLGVIREGAEAQGVQSRGVRANLPSGAEAGRGGH